MLKYSRIIKRDATYIIQKHVFRKYHVHFLRVEQNDINEKLNKISTSNLRDKSDEELKQLIGTGLKHVAISPKLHSTFIQILRHLLTRDDNSLALKTVAKMYSYPGSPFKETCEIERDERIAFKFYLQAAENGDAQAQYIVAHYYLHAYDILLKSFREEGEELQDDTDEDLFTDRESFVLDKETGTYIYMDPKSVRRKKVIEEREKRQDRASRPVTLPGLSTKASKAILKESNTLGMEWLYKSANQGYSEAQAMFAKHLLSGDIIPYNVKLAYEMLQHAAESGVADAMFDLANLYYTGKSGPIVPENETLLPLSGNPEEISSRCVDTFHVEQDISRAILLFQQAAEKDHPPSLFWLGHSYLHGIEGFKNEKLVTLLNKNPSKGLHMLHKAVDLKHPGATYYLSLLYLHGHEDILQRNIKKAQELYLASIELEHGEALFALADSYYHGTNEFELPLLGVIDIEKAFQIYKRAAKTGHADALYSLAVLYYHGKGTQQNYKRAYDLYTKASAHGNWRALGAMATMALEGQGIPKDEKYAMHLLSVYKRYEKAQQQN